MDAIIPNEPTPVFDHVLIAAFLENIPDAVYFKDRNSRFIAVSQSTALKHALKASELIGMSDLDLFPEANAKVYYAEEQEIIATGKPIIDKLVKETWPDGRETWSLNTKLPLRDERGLIVGTFGLGKDVTKSKEMEFALEKAHRELIDASHRAGMAEVATSVLHNVGNVLNSVNVSALVIAAAVKNSKAGNVVKLAALFHQHQDNLVEFLSNDPKGKLVPKFIQSVAQAVVEECDDVLKEIATLQTNIDHIKEIVSMQQAYATVVARVEPLDPANLVEDSLRLNATERFHHEVRVERQFQPVPPVLAVRAKMLQILINLIRNAEYACHTNGLPEKLVILRIEPGPRDRVRLIVQDNGVGIPAENLTRIFEHGFTTRPDGHGFGLHAAANAAAEMKGSLTVQSDGPGKGAAFTLEVPAAPTRSPNT
jgi:PAS domain S-box-containing protein